MLYVTTRVKQDTFPAMHTLNEPRGPEGGFFAPMRLPQLHRAEIIALGERSFSQNAAQVINLLFGTKLDGWAIEFAIGRYPVKLLSAPSRMVIAESWHNPAWHFERLARGIEKAIRQSDQISTVPTDWLLTASRIAVLFGVFGELIRANTASPDAPIDVAVPTGDFGAPMAAWYARKMGLPIHNILSCCNENALSWQLIHKGELHASAAPVATKTPLCDHAVPAGLELLVFETLGFEETLCFTETVRKNGNYYLEPHQLQALRAGLYATVVSENQLRSAVASLWSSMQYLADPYTALCVSGVGAYRSKSGESRTALILSEESPAHHLSLLADCLGTTAAELKKTID